MQLYVLPFGEYRGGLDIPKLEVNVRVWPLGREVRDMPEPEGSSGRLYRPQWCMDQDLKERAHDTTRARA